MIRGWHCLRKHDVDVNILCTVNAANQDHPLEVYHFFRDELKAQGVLIEDSKDGQRWRYA